MSISEADMLIKYLILLYNEASDLFLRKEHYFILRCLLKIYSSLETFCTNVDF